MDKPIDYAAFIKLCRVGTPDDWDGFHVKTDGVYVIPPPDDHVVLFPGERAVLSWHPTGNFNEPALPLPCTAKELQQFLEEAGVYGCVDPFDMLEFAQSKANRASTGKAKEAKEDQLHIMAPAAGDAVTRKRSALIDDVAAEWPTVATDLSDSNRNGLSRAKMEKHGYWNKSVALEWAKENGKLKTANNVQDIFKRAVTTHKI